MPIPNEDNEVVATTPEDITLPNNVEIEAPDNSEDTQNLDSSDLDIIDFLLKEDESQTEGKPTEPVFFQNKEEKIEEEEQFIDEELLEDIEK